MWQIHSSFDDSDKYYETLHQELLSLIRDEKNLIANLSNISAWINHSFKGLNWCGFYLWNEEDQELVLGPFQGKPACIRIKSDRGVCGAAYSQKQTIRVSDVNAFPGHIACDSASLSELVIPLIKDNRVYGVLDLDAPTLNHFSEKASIKLTQIMDDISPRIF